MNNIDKYIGERLLKIRRKRNFTQDIVASMVGLSRQQIQKYETGETRIPISTLFEISSVLGTGINYFLDGVENLEKRKGNSEYIEIKRNKPLNVLIVEDSVADILLTKDAINESNYDVNFYSASDGIEALSFLRNCNKLYNIPIPDLVLLDLSIPKKNGITVLKDIKNDVSLKGIPVVIITNSMNTREMNEVYRNGASGYMVKAFHPEEFFTKINIIISYWSNVILPTT